MSAATATATARATVPPAGAAARALLARVPAAAWALVLAVAPRGAYGRPRVGYDGWWALAWGRQLAHGGVPDLTAPVAPTPHPLAILVAAPLSLLGDAAPDVLGVLTLLALGAVGVTAAVLGARLFGPVAGALAAAILLTRPLLVGEALQGSVDVPFLALALGAAAALAHRDGPRAGRAAALLALAGLLRPEAWLLGLALLAWRRWGGRAAPGPGRLAVLAAVAAPLAWLLFDLACTGDPLHSLHGTRELADGLGRPQSLGTALRVAPDYLTVVLGDQVALLGGAAAIAALWTVPRRAALPLAVLGAGLAGFLVLGVAQLPLLYRYTLLPAAALALLAAWAPSTVRRTRGASLLALVPLALAVAPTVHGLDRQVTAARVLGGEQRDLTALVAAAPRCAADPLLPQRRAAPQVAYLLGRAPGAIRVGGAAPARGLIFTPAPGSRAIRDRLAPTDQPAPDPRATRSARPLATRGAWAVMSSC